MSIPQTGLLARRDSPRTPSQGAAHSDHDIRRPNSSSASAAGKIWFAGQAKLGLDPCTRRLPKVNTRSDRRCYNCGDTSHVADKCPRPRDEVRILKGRMNALLKGEDSKAALKILKELLMEIA